MQNDNNIPLILLGSFLALVATALVEIARGYYTLRKSRKNLCVYLNLQLLSVQEILGKIKARQEANHFYDYALLDILESELTRLDSARPEAIYLESEEVKKKFFKLLTELSLFIKEARAIQQLFYNETEKIKNPEKHGKSIFETPADLEKSDGQRRNEMAIELIEINRKIDELLRDIG